MQTPKLSVKEFAAKIKAKYPDYAPMGDLELTRRILAKYPEYQDSLNVTIQQTPLEPVHSTAGTRSGVESAGAFVRGAANAVNPLPGLAQGVESQRQFARTGERPQAPITGIAQSHAEQFSKAKASFDEGNYTEALGHTLAALLPLVGPAVANSAEKMGEGQVAEGLGEVAALALPSALARKPSATLVPGVKSRLNPVEQRAVAFGERQGIPIDAATGTGSRLIRNAQALVQNQPGGSGVAQAARQVQSDAIASTGQRLMDRVASPVTAEQAGADVRATLNQRIARLKREADAQYAKLRAAEADPANVESVEVGRASAAVADFYGRMINESVDARLAGIKDVARSGATEMTGKLKREINPANKYDTGEVTGRFGGGFKEAFPELRGFPESPSQMATAIEKGSGALYDRLRKKMRDVVEEQEGAEIRSALRDNDVSFEFGSSSTVASEASGAPITKDMALPVNMAVVKRTLRPIYDEMKRTMPTTQQQASKGLKALENVINSEDWVPASVADQNLSAIKGIVRESVSKDLRNKSQGLAARAVRELEEEVQAAFAKAGPEASKALELGRTATAAKYATADTLKALRKEPVQVFRQLTARKDSAVELLRDVAKKAPEELPKIGRAYLEDLLETATKEGGYGKAGTVMNQWNALGKESKRLMFKNPALVEDLDNFFMLAKKIAENPNPSGSAVVGALVPYGYLFMTEPLVGTTAIIGNNVLARLLFNNPKAAKALMRGMKVPLGNKAAAAVASSEILNIVGKNRTPAMIPSHASTARGQ